MDIKQALLIGVTGALINADSPKTPYSNPTSKELAETFYTPSEKPLDPLTLSSSFKNNIIWDQAPSFLQQTLQKVTIQNLEGTPFRWKKRIINPNYWNLLGYSQAKAIMEDYNDLSSVDPNQKLLWNEEITFPLIYPELEAFFPKRLETLLLYPSFEKYSNQMMKHTIIVSCCENGKTALAYYENWKLKLATYVSAWTKNHKTIKGKYPLNHSSIYRRSQKYNRAPMPYSLNINWGYFLHQWRSNGNPQSHGCIRVPGLYIKWLYEHLPRSQGEAIIILEDLYTPTLKKIGNKKSSN